ncbi:MAG: glycosidase [Verrucomicrobia bacterium]|jgi:beta-1,4-mannooligosaccharide/beta-1,4-mannosyl-N-acetylglucosamine phosphorylase|nr:glycosidase [Verrucomicrobiota bacterium]MBT7067679.1 glycosidase [Verrucomicrobiota bacterium]MBT7699780.1 glycosidase [Verrucomicrobiota bacterium]
MSEPIPFAEVGLLKRHPQNPLLTSADVDYPCSLLFNAGIAKYQGRYVMVFRNDFGAANRAESMQRKRQGLPAFDGTDLGLAFSADGVKWEVQPEPCIGLETARELIAPLMPGKDFGDELKRFYDPRLTVIEGRVTMCFAVDTAHGLRGGVAVTEDFEQWEILSVSVPDNRNMVLFPEKIGGRYVRLERPVDTAGANRLRDDQAMMWMSYSPDLRHWGDSQHVLATESIPFANSKMGPGAPPIRTEKGWLTTFHAVWRDNERGRNGWESQWPKIYMAGLMLLDIDNPCKIIGFCDQPLLAPTAWYETGNDVPDGDPFDGFREDVIFPGGMLLEDDGEVKIYYGAADTVECLATAHVDDLLALCKPL